MYTHDTNTCFGVDLMQVRGGGERTRRPHVAVRVESNLRRNGLAEESHHAKSMEGIHVSHVQRQNGGR